MLRTRKIFGDDVRGVISERWRSIDLDDPEDFVVAELLYANKSKLEADIKKFT